MNPLNRIPDFPDTGGPVVLCIMDGIAEGPVYDGNAVANAYTPNLNWLKEHCPGTLLKAHGTAVGMPTDGDMGNSEVGHNAIGSGRVFAQGATLVKRSIKSGDIFRGTVWNDLVENCVKHQSTLHFIGLFSDGNVHSHLDHLKAMIKQASESQVKRIRVHALLDGRDVGETSALDYIDPFEDFLLDFRNSGLDYRIASGGGRMNITMDRYGADWDMVRRGWDTHVRGEGRAFDSAHDAITTLRKETSAIDQDLPAFVITDGDQPVGRIEDQDAVILFNFRGDRAIELCNAFELDGFDKFDRVVRPQVMFAAITEYDSDLKVPRKFLVNPPELDRTIGEYLAISGVSQMAISETQKFGHVTYFFNGNRSGKFSEELENYIEIRSDMVPFEQRPWMKAAEITDSVIDGIKDGNYQFIRLNYPNGDMIGHTGNYLAAIISVETVDLCVGRLISTIRKLGGVLIVTADHGNADEMFEFDKKSRKVKIENGKPKAKTCHSLNPVPCYIYAPNLIDAIKLSDHQNLGISSLAATCLTFLGFEPPGDYEPTVFELG